MKCPFCGADNDKVLESRSADSGVVTRRRRECLGCARRFNTVERVEISPPAVIKRDGRREPFSREKILSGLRSACAKRPVPTEALNRVVSEVERAAAGSAQAEIAASELGALVMRHLRALDDIAYIRFASVYRRFEDVDSLLAEAEAIQSAPHKSSTPDQQPDLPL